MYTFLEAYFIHFLSFVNKKIPEWLQSAIQLQKKDSHKIYFFSMVVH